MVAVTIEEARAAREESQRLRIATAELRLIVQAQKRTTLARRDKAAAAAAARCRKRLEMPAPSPWSGLEWHRATEELRTALVPVD